LTHPVRERPGGSGAARCPPRWNVVLLSATPGVPGGRLQARVWDPQDPASTRLLLPVRMLILFTALLVISVKFTLLLLCLLPIVILPTLALTRKLRKSIGSELEGEAGPIDIMTESFHGIRAIKAFAGGDYEVAVVPEPARAVLSRWDERIGRAHV